MNLFEEENFRWKRYTDKAQFDYPIDYSGTVLSAQEDGHVDVLYRWAPNSACHLHRHTAELSSLVLEGELHVIDIDPETGKETGRLVKKAGHYAHKPAGDVHIEVGGPEGALVMFSIYAPEGVLTEGLSRKGEVKSESTVEQILSSLRRRELAGSS